MDPSRFSPDELNFGELVAQLQRRWRLLLGVPAACVAAALVLALVWPKTYTANASFTAEQSSSGGLASTLNSLGSLGGLLGQAGLPSSLGGSALTPDFFAEVVKSREITDAALRTEFAAPGGGRARPLQELLRPRGGTAARRLGNARRKLNKATDVTVDRRTGIVTVAVGLRDPVLAAEVANRLVVLLNDFNLERRQSSSRRQRRFTEDRLAEVRNELREAEQAEVRFVAANRGYESSPVLEREALRLARELRLKQDVFVSLSKAYEDARIAEVKDTPVLTVIDRAVPPDRPAWPRPVLWTVAAFILGVLAALAFAFVSIARAGEPRPAAEPAPRDGEPWQPAPAPAAAIARGRARIP